MHTCEGAAIACRHGRVCLSARVCAYVHACIHA